jgi:hypothetical protein
LGVLRAANRTAAPDYRHALGGSGTKQREFQIVGIGKLKLEIGTFLFWLCIEIGPIALAFVLVPICEANRGIYPKGLPLQIPG